MDNTQYTYFAELGIALQKAGYTVDSGEAGVLPVAWNDGPLCRVTEYGGIRFRGDDTAAPAAEAARNRVTDIAGVVREYMTLIEQAPDLKADGLGENYKLLADFNGAVLAGHPSRYGVEFVTWEWNYGRTGLWQGHYPDAVTLLLGGSAAGACSPTEKQAEVEKKQFELPPANHTMRHVYAYLLKKRHIQRDVLNAFVHAGLIYEDEKYHNAVFVGKDEHGVACHAHKRSTHDTGKTFRINVEGSDPRCSFHWTGVSDRLYVFEGPIDLLSYITLHPEDWRKHNYVACCGTSSLPVLWMLEHNPVLRDVCLCLDNDKAGHTASLRLAEQIAERFEIASSRLIPENKDWNDDLAELAEQGHPVQMVQQMG